MGLKVAEYIKIILNIKRRYNNKYYPSFFHDSIDVYWRTFMRAALKQKKMIVSNIYFDTWYNTVILIIINNFFSVF